MNGNFDNNNFLDSWTANDMNYIKKSATVPSNVNSFEKASIAADKNTQSIIMEYLKKSNDDLYMVTDVSADMLKAGGVHPADPFASQLAKSQMVQSHLLNNHNYTDESAMDTSSLYLKFLSDQQTLNSSRSHLPDSAANFMHPQYNCPDGNSIYNMAGGRQHQKSQSVDYTSMDQAQMQMYLLGAQNSGESTELCIPANALSPFFSMPPGMHCPDNSLNNSNTNLANLNASLLSPGSNENLMRGGHNIKRKRYFDVWQVRILEAQYSKCKYPSTKDKRQLAHTVELSEYQVSVWFQNRRVKENKCKFKHGSLQANGKVSYDE